MQKMTKPFNGVLESAERVEKNRPLYEQEARSSALNEKRAIVLLLVDGESHFEEACKPLVQIDGMELARVSHLPFSHLSAKRGFVVSDAHASDGDLMGVLCQIGLPHYQVYSFESGFSEDRCLSSMLAAGLFDRDGVELFLAESSQYAKFDVSKLYDFVYDAQKATGRRVDGAVLCFEENQGSAEWSFVDMEKDGVFIRSIRDKNAKEPVHRVAACGIYWWRRGSDFARYASKAIQSGKTRLADVVNEAAKDGLSFVDFPVEEMHSLKTPSDVEAFENYLSTSGRNIHSEEAI